MAALSLAEREGIGVDRMSGDMLARGLPGPEISETAASGEGLTFRRRARP